MLTKPTSEKKWSELDHEGNRHFYRLLADRADTLDELMISSRIEFAKYLFAANTGAAAGLFLLLRSSQENAGYLTSFFLFCTGTFFVGIAHFSFASWIQNVSDGWANDFNRLGRDEIVFGELDARHKRRFNSLKGRISKYALILSFGFLVAGGVTAAKPFWSKPGSIHVSRMSSFVITENK